MHVKAGKDACERGHQLVQVGNAGGELGAHLKHVTTNDDGDGAKEGCKIHSSNCLDAANDQAKHLVCHHAALIQNKALGIFNEVVFLPSNGELTYHKLGENGVATVVCEGCTAESNGGGTTGSKDKETLITLVIVVDDCLQYESLPTTTSPRQQVNATRRRSDSVKRQALIYI